MHGFAFGPLVVPSNVLALLIAIAVAAVVARSVAGLNRTRVSGVVMDMLLAAFVAARLVFVALWFDRYLDNAWGWLDVRDGGFTVWACPRSCDGAAARRWESNVHDPAPVAERGGLPRSSTSQNARDTRRRNAYRGLVLRC